jgi:hypothetical protein
MMSDEEIKSSSEVRPPNPMENGATAAFSADGKQGTDKLEAIIALARKRRKELDKK